MEHLFLFKYAVGRQHISPTQTTHKYCFWPFLLYLIKSGNWVREKAGMIMWILIWKQILVLRKVSDSWCITGVNEQHYHSTFLSVICPALAERYPEKLLYSYICIQFLGHFFSHKTLQNWLFYFESYNVSLLILFVLPLTNTFWHFSVCYRCMRIS